MPSLVIMNTSGDAQLVGKVREAIQKSRFAASTEVVLDDLAKVEALLGLKPMTRIDGARRDALRR